MLIHKFTLGETRIVLDINSGAIHLVDGLLYDLLDVFDGANKDDVRQFFAGRYADGEIEEGLNELAALVEEGLLFTPPAPAGEFFSEQPIVKSLCLHIAHDCNLRCRYCFASTGGFGAARSLMSKETGEAAVEFAIAGSQGRTNLDIDFFGGEPLLNKEVVIHLVNYARRREQEAGKNIKLTLTTNGVLLDEEMTDFLYANRVLLVLSLDGRPGVHDNMRPFAGGRGSYQAAAANFKKAIDLRQGKDYYLRGTYTSENLDFAEDVLHMASIGKELSMEPVVEKDAPYRIKEEDLPHVFAEYEKLAHIYIEKQKKGEGFNFFHFNIALDGGPCLLKRLAGCGAGHEYFAITPEGDIYPCHQFVGREQYKMGSLAEGITRPDKTQEFRRAHILNKPDCMACWAKFYCSGGCHANADLMNGDILKPYELGCEIQKKRLECAIAAQAILASE